MFVDVSGFIVHDAPGSYTSVAVADLDGDGRPEFMVGARDGPNRLLRFSADRLRDAASPLVADVEGRSLGLAAADLDGDGREELYIRNSAGEPGFPRDRLLKAHLDGGWEDLFARTENRHIRNASAGGGVAVIDRRGVGRYGFFVANHDRTIRFYEQAPDGRLTDLALPLGLAHACADGILTAPILSGHPDIICTNEHGPNFVFRNQGDGTFIECARTLGLANGLESGRCLAAVDANGDAELDLCWGGNDSPHRLMVREESGAWRDRATAALALPSAARAVVAADFDNDGHDELFFVNLGEPNRLFRIMAARESEPAEATNLVMIDPGQALDAEGEGTAAAVCDVDGDGVLELLIARGETTPQPLGLYKSRGAERNNWIRIRPLTRFCAPARGATVRMESRGRVRVRAICGGTSSCQMEPVAHFGLGREGRAERIQVVWPDGASVILLNPGVNRNITVPYPRG